MTEQTLIVIKPDGVKRHLCGMILSRFEQKGFEISKIKSLYFTSQKAKDFYAPHKDKSFFADLVTFITSGMIIACVLNGPNAINTVRVMIGATRSFESAPGTIRGDLGLGITDNVIHASDSYESFIKESRVIFDCIK